MLKRVFAWLLLIGFILLLVNIFLLHIFIQASFVVYAIIVVIFLFTKRKRA